MAERVLFCKMKNKEIQIVGRQLLLVAALGEVVNLKLAIS